MTAAPSTREQPATALVWGAADGVLATALMSAAMLLAKRSGAMGAMPPEKITARFLNSARIPRTAEQQDALAIVFHFAFGAVGGACFRLAAARIPAPAVPLGMAYGTGIWAASYLGWVPALRIMPAADRDRRGRQFAMIAGHLVYGSTLGLLVARRRSPGPFPAVEHRTSLLDTRACPTRCRRFRTRWPQA
ncbi:MAG TPA: DUF6789 family protein [Candidatus Saccharimonadales bacterium]|nr:DUF6789 family protein [Candidatus Saccharimonadales bacterium]